ncbi:MAG TPA: hypothetical protein VG994_13475 [Steroidobacteraceae bacterium]|nr:hypothetical protein [Steroidobacteraceae bacterium]
MSVGRRAWVLLLALGLLPVANAEDPSAPQSKPATTGKPPTPQPTQSAPAAPKATSPSATQKAPAALPPEAAEPDDELLEFLGSVDGLEELEK